jgi:hemin uptake protein HemP
MSSSFLVEIQFRFEVLYLSVSGLMSRIRSCMYMWDSDLLVRTYIGETPALDTRQTIIDGQSVRPRSQEMDTLKRPDRCVDSHDLSGGQFVAVSECGIDGQTYRLLTDTIRNEIPHTRE